jgi:hypothetical protein
MDFSIRQCDQDEALEILQHPSVVKPLKVFATEIKDNFEWWIIGEKALLAVKPKGDIVEVHIACKMRDRAGLKEHLVGGMNWLKDRGFSGAETTAPDERKALINMLKSLNFTKESDRWIARWV